MKLLCIGIVVVSFTLGQGSAVADLKPGTNALRSGEVSINSVVGGGVVYSEKISVNFDIPGKPLKETLGALRKYVAGRVKKIEETGYKKAKDAFEQEIKILKGRGSEASKKLVKVEAALEGIDQKHFREIATL